MSPCKHRLGISGAWPCALGEGHDGAHVSSNGACALSSYVEPSNYNAHYIDIADVQYGAVPVYLLRQAQKERDEAAAVKELESNVRRLARERDEARAALVSLQEEYEIMRQDNERLERLFQQTHGVHHSWVDARHKVAERQREACAVTVEKNVDDLMLRKGLAEDVRDTPLVTEGEP